MDLWNRFEKWCREKAYDRWTWDGATVCIGLSLLTCLVATAFYATCSAKADVAAIVAGFFSSTIGMSEIISRYRDEPLKACRNVFGIAYIHFNAILGASALFVVWRYPEKFGFAPGIAPPLLISAAMAGFGASAVMRTRLMVLRGSDNKDISVGPDIVIKIFLSMVDRYLDRNRAADRDRIVFDTLPELLELGRYFGNFRSVSDYLMTSLLALQNIEEEEKKKLGDIFSDYAKQPLPDAIKYLAMSFVFLTVVGESRFKEIIQHARQGLRPLPTTNTPPP